MKQDKRFDINRTLPTYDPQRRPATPIESPYPEENPKKRRRFGWKRALLLIFILILIPPTVIGYMDVQNASSASQKLFGTGDLTGALRPTILDSTKGRTNILLIGNSSDDPGHAGALLTDSIMIISLDKDKKSGYMLSVPRDLYVDIPDYGSAKINEAFQAGEQQNFSEKGYPTGGAGLLQKVITDTFDIKLQYYVIVNYGAVRDITNALGGITVNIESTDSRGIYDPNFKPEEGGPLKLANGPQTIDGQTALRLTRARGSTYGSYGFPVSDFNRTQNQQKVFAAIKSELDWKLILDPRLNKQFFDAIANNTQTNLELSEVLPLFRLMKSVPDGQLTPVNLRDFNGQNLLTGYTTRSGQSALIPAAGIDNYSDIQAAIESLSQ
jgi:polyisoprenyl-teichoic acid--peptidoglycan teichoic acid transferase